MPSASVIDATAAQLPRIAEIYAEAVAAGPATFDLQAPPLAWWRGVLESVDPSAGHLLLAALDEHGEVLGYAKSGRFRPKAAYDSTCETSVYVAAEARGSGVGTALYAELLARLDCCGLRLAVAGVTVPNPASARLHLAHGFHEVGTFAGVGVKFGSPWDVTWFERPLRGAELLDELRGVASGDGTRAAAAERFVAALRRAGGHRSVVLSELDGDMLRPFAAAGDEPAAPPAVDLAALATGRPQRLAHDIRGTIVVPVVERPAGRVRGALAVEPLANREIDTLEQGLLSACADVALALCGG